MDFQACNSKAGVRAAYNEARDWTLSPGKRQILERFLNICSREHPVIKDHRYQQLLTGKQTRQTTFL